MRITLEIRTGSPAPDEEARGLPGPGALPQFATALRSSTEIMGRLIDEKVALTQHIDALATELGTLIDQRDAARREADSLRRRAEDCDAVNSGFREAQNDLLAQLAALRQFPLATGSPREAPDDRITQRERWFEAIDGDTAKHELRATHLILDQRDAIIADQRAQLAALRMELDLRGMPQ